MAATMENTPGMWDEPEFKNLDGFVDADSFAYQALWEKHHEELGWAGNSSGYLLTVGHLDKRPITVETRFATVAGKKLCFWCSPSQVVDHILIRKWFDKYFKGIPHEDATSFYNILR